MPKLRAWLNTETVTKTQLSNRQIILQQRGKPTNCVRSWTRTARPSAVFTSTDRKQEGTSHRPRKRKIYTVQLETQQEMKATESLPCGSDALRRRTSPRNLSLPKSVGGNIFPCVPVYFPSSFFRLRLALLNVTTPPVLLHGRGPALTPRMTFNLTSNL